MLSLPTSQHWWPMPLRLMLGFGFLYHGLPKVASSPGHAMFVGMLRDIGVPAPDATAWFVGVVEVAGGLALLAGAFVALATIPLIIDMLVAAFTVHLPAGFSFMNVIGMNESGPVLGMPGMEIPFLYIAGLLALLIGGAGAWSVDARMAAARPGRLT